MLTVTQSTAPYAPGTSVRVLAPWPEEVYLKRGTVKRFEPESKLYAVQVDGWRSELCFRDSEIEDFVVADGEVSAFLLKVAGRAADMYKAHPYRSDAQMELDLVNAFKEEARLVDAHIDRLMKALAQAVRL